MTPLTRNASALAILAATFLARWPFRRVPLIRDEGELAHLAQALRQGIVPYLEIYNQKPPGAFLLVAALQSAAGESLETLRIGTTLWLLLGGIALFALAARRLGDRAALLSLAAWAVMVVGQAGFFHQASTEALSLPWLVLGLAAWLRAVAPRPGIGSGSRWPRATAAVLAGAAAAIAYQTKQTTIALAGAIALDALLSARRREMRTAGALAVTGFAAVTASVLAALASAGALGAYLDATWLHNWSYVGARHPDLSGATGPAGTPLRAALSTLPILRADLPLWLSGALGLVALGWRERNGPLRSIPLLGATTLAAALLAGHGYAHYYVPLIAPLSLGVGALGAALARGLPAALAAALIAAVFAAPVGRLLSLEANPQQAIDAVLERAPTVRTAGAVAAWVADQTRPGEPISVLGSEPQVYFLADRPAATRMPILYPISGGYPHSDALLDEMVRDLRTTPARYVILAEDWRSFAEARPNADRLQRRLEALLDAGDFEVVHEFPGAYRVLRRAGAATDRAGRLAEATDIELVLLVTIDTLRADHLGAYGSTTTQTPALDALAEGSLRFTASFAPAPYTMPSIAALHTGRYPEELGILANHALFRGTDATLAALVRERGWRTGAVVSNYVLRRGTGIEAGFERYDDAFTRSETNRDQPERAAGDTTAAALEMLDALRSEPGAGVFLWVHYQDPHGPYLPPGDLRERHLAAASAAPDGDVVLPVRGVNPIGAIPGYQVVDDRRDVAFYRAGYAGEVDYVDAEIGRLLEGVADRMPIDRALFVFTADHGESLGEDDYWFAHGAFLSDPLVRVPLLIRGPGIAPATRRDIASLVDLVPTLAGQLGIELPGEPAGRDLLAPRASEETGRAYLANLMGGRDKRWGWVGEGHVFVRETGADGTTRTALRGLEDARPVHDPARSQRLEGELDAFRASLRVRSEVQQHLSPRDIEMLRQLGYVD